MTIRRSFFAILAFLMLPAIGCGDSSKSDQTTDGTSSGNPYALEVSNQNASDGNALTIDRVVAGDQPVWLAVTEGADVTSQGKLANKLISSGAEKEDLKINLSKKLQNETQVTVALHYDNPADGSFTYSPDNTSDEDMIVRKSAGQLKRAVTLTPDN